MKMKPFVTLMFLMITAEVLSKNLSENERANRAAFIQRLLNKEKYLEGRVKLLGGANSFEVYLGEVLVGIFTGWISPVISKLQNPDETPLSKTIDDVEASLIGAVAIVGVVIGAQIAGVLCNLKGRKVCLILGGMNSAAALLFLAVSTKWWMVLVGRLFIGLGAGPTYILNMTYIAEVSSQNNRGFYLTGMGMATALGLVIAYSVGPLLSYQGLNYASFGLSMVFILCLFFIPETPTFKAMKGRDEDAKKTLLRLGRLEEIEDVYSPPTSTKIKTCSSITSILSTRSNRKAIMIAAVLLVLQQTCGRLCVIFYGSSIFKLAGSKISPSLATIFIGLSELVASCLVPLLSGRIGRKVLMLITTAMCCLCLLILGAFFYVRSINPELAEQVYWLPLVSLMVFLINYALGFGIIPNTWISEMLDSTARGPGTAMAFSISWIFTILTTSTFGYINTTLGSHWTFWIYSVSCAIAFLFTAILVPDTTGKTLTEIQHMLSK